MSTKKKFIESHWLIFGLQGLIALVFGWFIMFTDITEIPTLVNIVPYALLTLGVAEMFNAIYRKHRQHTWASSLMIALVEIGVAVALLITKDCCNVAVHLTIIAGYTLVRGLFQTLVGLRSLTDATDKFLWIVTGIFGIVLGFVIFNSGNLDLANTTFIKIFGTYMMVFGLTDIIYAVHVKNERVTAKSEKPAKKAKKTKK